MSSKAPDHRDPIRDGQAGDHRARVDDEPSGEDRPAAEAHLGSPTTYFFASIEQEVRKALRSQPLQQADREDCCQEVLTEILLKGLARLEHGNVQAWLGALARNKAVDHIRRRQRQRIVGLTLDLAKPLDQGVPAELADEARARVWETLAALENVLEPRSFLVFYLRVIEAWPFQEIADVLGLTAAQARLRHHRAKQKFRDLIDTGASEALAG